jgi:hypothetical protein
MSSFKSKVGLKGKVTAKVYVADGSLKYYPRNWFQKLLGLPAKPMISVNHNIVTNEGDALVADQLSNVPVRAKIDTASGIIGVGTGFTVENKASDALVTQTGSDEAMDTGYPQPKGAWTAADDNVTVYRATFEAGDLNATGIDEALLGSASDTLAYAQISPAVDVSTSDTLEVTWEITFLGA